MSQMNPNGQSNNGYHPNKRNVGHRGGQPYNPYAAQGYAPDYMGGYQQAYSYYPSGQPYYAGQAGYVAVQPVYSPRQAQDYNNGQHQLNITTASGDKVDLKNLNSTVFTPKHANASLNRSSVSTPKASTPYTHQRTPSAASSTSGNKELDAMRESFRQQVLARKQKKEATASPTITEAKPVELKKEASPAPAPVEVKPKTADPIKSKSPSPAPVSSTSEKSEQDKDTVRKFKELVAAKKKTSSTAPEVSPKANEDKEISKPATEEAKSVETKSEVQTATAIEETTPQDLVGEKPKTEDTESVKPEEPEIIKEETEPAEASKDDEESNQSEPKEEEKPTAPEFTISKLFEQIAKAKIIEDPYNFKYPEGKTAPTIKAEIKTKKYSYNPEFLMQFAEVTSLPLDEAFKDRFKFIQISDKRNDRSLSKGGPGGFRSGFGQGSISGIQGSSFSKSGSSRKQFDLNSRSNSRQNSKRRGGGSGRNERKSNRNRDRDNERERESEVPAEPVKPLEKSANRWIPKSRLAKTQEVKYAPDGVTVILSPEDVSRKVKSLLNKLTLEFFEDISNDIINIANQSKWETNAETLGSVLEFTFAKACDEPHWSSMYAQFCAKMCKDIDPEIKKEGEIRKDGEPLTGGGIVRKLLLSRCQIEYQKGWADKLPTNEDGSALDPEMMSDEYYAAAAAKRRGLGLIRFIGHLFVLGLLSEPIIFVCLKDQSKNVTDPSEDTVENLIQLVKTVGQALDFSPNERTRATFDAFFQSIPAMAEKAKLPSRLQFKLMDLVDLRKRRWSGGESDAGPKTITEIHEEAEKKQRDHEREQKEKRNQHRGDSRSNSSRGAWGNSNRVSSSDIKNVGVVRNSNSSSNLGPTNNFTRTKSQRSSSRQSSQNLASENPTPSPASPLSARENSKKSEPAGNRFTLLHEDNQPESDEEDEDEQEHEKLEEQQDIEDSKKEEEDSKDEQKAE